MITVAHLRTARLDAPRGIVILNPEFTWELASDREADAQTACAVEVERVLPDADARVVWRPDPVRQPIGTPLRYAGEPLVSRSDYRWRVMVWDAEERQSPWSEWICFETGVMAPDQITAKWIAGGAALRGGVAAGTGVCLRPGLLRVFLQRRQDVRRRPRAFLHRF